MEENKQNMMAKGKESKFEDDEFEFNFAKILQKIWNVRRTLYRAAMFGALLGLIFAFSVPKQYTVSVTLSPELGEKPSSSGLASMAASLLGTSFGKSGSDALNALLAPEIVVSTPFLLELLDSRVVNPKEEVDTTFRAYLDEESRPWWNYIVSIPGKTIGAIKSLFVDEEESNGKPDRKGAIVLSKEESERLRGLRSKISTGIDKKTSIISLTIKLQDPVITAMVADSMVTKLQRYIINYKISKAKDDADYWSTLYKQGKDNYYTSQQRYAKYVDENTNVVFQSTLVERERLQSEMSLAYQVYNQVAQQYQMAEAKVQEEKPSFAIIEPAVVPIYPSSMSKSVMLLAFVFLSVLITLGWELIGKTFFFKFKEKLN